MKISIGGDHAGYDYKKDVIDFLNKNNHEVKDFGTYSSDSVDYPDFAHPVAESVEKDETQMGILICGSGNGVAITANKHQGIRAGLCWNVEVAKLIRQHNNANIICVPARFVSKEEALDMITTFLNTPFEGGRHADRVKKIGC